MNHLQNSQQQDGGPSDSIHVVAALVVRSGRLLTVRKAGTQRFMLPGGKRDENEDDLACLARELVEELGCTIDGVATCFFGEFSAPAANEPGRTVHARLYRTEVTGVTSPSAEIDQVAWLPLDESPSVPLAPLLEMHILPALRESVLA